MAIVKVHAATYQNGQNKNGHIKSEVKTYLVSEQEWIQFVRFAANYWTLLIWMSNFAKASMRTPTVLWFLTANLYSC